MSDSNPPRILGILLSALGIAMFIGGINIYTMDGGYYFIAVGIGIIISGVLIALGKILGAYAYGITLFIIVAWSFVESGSNIQQLLPRIAVPILLGIYILSSKVRSRLV